MGGSVSSFRSMSAELDNLQLQLEGRYSVEKPIGRGGMATVYLARDLKHSREVAIKVLRPDLAEAMGPDRFLQEIQIAAQLQHPHIVALYDSGAAGDALYYVMPYIEGESLRDRLVREESLSVNDAIVLVEEVAGALEYAHGKKVVHRDIKPENILLSGGHSMVADFGIAKAVSTAVGKNLTRTGFPLGTVGYMSPEQAAGATDLDETTDVYSLACVCYELIVGEVPGFWVNDESYQKGIFLKAPPAHRARLDMIPGSVEEALVRGMAMDSADRTPTPKQFSDSLFDTTSRKREYREDEVRKIVEKAAELEVLEDTSEAMTIGGVKRLAAEVGIPARHVEQAARAVTRGAPVAPVSPSRKKMFGFLVGSENETIVAGEVGDDEIEYMVDELRRELGSVGVIDRSLGRSLTWTSNHSGQEGLPRTTVHIMPRKGRTTIRILEDPTQTYAVAAVGVVATALLAGPLSAMGVEPTFIGAGLGMALAGTIQAARWFRKKRQVKIANLLDRLKMLASDAIAEARSR